MKIYKPADRRPERMLSSCSLAAAAWRQEKPGGSLLAGLDCEHRLKDCDMEELSGIWAAIEAIIPLRY